MTEATYTKGLHEVADGVFAYLQPDGGWGWSNAGLVVDDGRSLLIDTLFDLPLTSEMLDHMRRDVPEATSIDLLVNTHANGDHCFGNELVEGAEIVASRRCADEMAETGPQVLAGFLAAAPGMGETGAYVQRIFGSFQFEGITPALPQRTFEGEMELTVGGRRVVLLEVGPAHTQGDVMVYLPDDRVLFAGDILFNGGHPIVWAGPVSNWVAACERILGMDVDVVVPGHGPLAGKDEVASLKGYLEYVTREARRRFDDGMPPLDAARDIPLDQYATWGDGERIVVNVAALYREFGGDPAADVVTLFGHMAELAR